MGGIAQAKVLGQEGAGSLQGSGRRQCAWSMVDGMRGVLQEEWRGSRNQNTHGQVGHIEDVDSIGAKGS